MINNHDFSKSEKQKREGGLFEILRTSYFSFLCVRMATTTFNSCIYRSIRCVPFSVMKPVRDYLSGENSGKNDLNLTATSRTSDTNHLIGSFGSFM